MRIGVTYRLSFIILCATVLTILCLFLIMWWSLDREFNHYIRMIDQERLTGVIGDLSRRYGETGNWNFLRESPPYWGAIGEVSPSQKAKSGPPMPSDRQKPNIPLVLLDADRKPLYGFRMPGTNLEFLPIVVEGTTVGYVGLASPPHFLHPMQVRFLARQKSSLILAASAMVLVVILISYPLARRVVKPIRELAAATHDIASGRYATRISHLPADEMGQLGRDFNSMALTLEKNEKERREWIADISHELRTPVAVLQGEIEALLDGVHQMTPEAIHSLHSETLRLKSLIDDLYQLSLSDLNALNYQKEHLDPMDGLRDSMESFSSEFDRKNISVTLECPDAPGATVFADGERLGQLFRNLLENSLRYTDAGGELRIAATARGGFLALEFMDSAPGVSTGDRERLFDRFFRVEGSRNRASGGAGLGLTICKKIVEAHEGRISAHESPLGGLLIRILLPISKGG